MNALRRVSMSVLLAVATSSVVVTASAEPTARLSYARGVGAESCPSEEQFRRAVAARLGEDPFSEQAERSFRVELVLREKQLVGHVALRDERDDAQRVRSFESSADCAELTAAMALAVSLAINPELGVSRDAPGDAPAARAPQTAAPERAPAPAPAPAPNRAPPQDVTDGWRDAGAPRANHPEGARELALGAGVLGLGAFGVGPAANVAGVLVVRARSGRGSMSLEGRYDAPSREALGQVGSFASSLLSGAVAPCWHHGWMAGCAVGLVGRIHAESVDAPEDGSDSALYAAAGGRFAAELPLASHVSVGGRVEVLGTLTRVHFVRNQALSVWDAPPGSVSLGFGVMAQIP